MTESIIIAIIGGIISLLVAVVPKLMEKKSQSGKALSALVGKVDDLSAEVKSIKSDLAQNGDMTYQMLDHMATNNNTGNMRRCLDQYNAYFRKKGD